MSIEPKKDVLISVVIPVYNSEKIVGETVTRVSNYLSNINVSFEIILVNDGSSDNSWKIISELAKANNNIYAINLLKNYGQHVANLCGFHEATGEYIVTLDDDLQNPPEEIGKLLSKAQEGFDLVIGRFQTKKHSIIRRIGSQIVGYLNRSIFGVSDKLVLSNYRIIHRDVITRICQGDHVKPYIPGLLLKYSRQRTNVLVDHQPRQHGKSNYNLRKLLGLIASLLFNHSTLPLRFAAVMGFFTAIVSAMLGIYFMLDALYHGINVPGWASLIVFISFFNAILILLISIIGEYVIRVLREVSSGRPYEVVEIVRQ